MNPGVAGLEDCESFLTHVRTKEMIAEEYLVRHFLSIRQAVAAGGLENAYWLSGARSTAYGFINVCSDMALLRRLLESGCRDPGHLRPIKGVSWRE